LKEYGFLSVKWIRVELEVPMIMIIILATKRKCNAIARGAGNGL